MIVVAFKSKRYKTVLSFILSILVVVRQAVRLIDFEQTKTIEKRTTWDT